MPTGLTFALPGMEITCPLHAPTESLEHAALIRRPAAAEESEHRKEDKHIPLINPFCITSLQLPELRTTLNS